jgi:SAM-dependent methyltransferase
MDDIDRKADGHRLGNFHNYYNFHDKNSRLALLPVNFFHVLWQSLGKPSSFLILDVGCNEGDLTVEIHRRARNEIPSSVSCLTLGIDVDPVLIERANKKFPGDHVFFLEAKFLDDDEGVPTVRRFLQEKCGDSEAFSFVSLFSITMWVHLNHGDDGVVKFIKAATDLTAGSILIEPQPWKCYRSAARRCRKLGIAPHAHYQDLEIRDIDAEACKLMRLPDYGMKSFWPLGTETWGRSLLVFHRGDSRYLEAFPLRQLAEDTEETKIARETKQTREIKGNEESSENHGTKRTTQQYTDVTKVDNLLVGDQHSSPSKKRHAAESNL